MKAILKGARVLITGGAGSVGRALTKGMLKYSPRAIRIYDISENETSRMRSDFGKENRIRYLIGDIRDMERLKLAMEGIDIVVHLAAMKHVHACEYNPFEAIKINIDGLQNVINVARDENVKKMIFASTDKAAHPTNVMGMTKLLGEKIISLANNYSRSHNKKTLFASVRFGNVLGSNGSVVPIFKKQIQAGGPLTITDRDMTRFVITMSEAVELIYKAIKLARGAETFVWKMRTVKVTDIAEAMIKRISLGKNIKMFVKGKDQGEKLHEEIMSQEELPRAMETDNMYIIFPEIDYFHVAKKHKGLKKIRDPIMRSNIGKHIIKREIEELLEKCIGGLTCENIS